MQAGGNTRPVRIHKVLSQTFRKAGRGLNAAADVDAVISANVGETGKTSRTHVSSRKRVVQRSGRTVVSEEQREQKDEKEV
jgi:hypothetical protein